MKVISLILILAAILICLMMLCRLVGFGVLFVVFRMKLKLNPEQTDYSCFEKENISVEKGTVTSGERELTKYLFTRGTERSKKLAVLNKGTGLFCPDYRKLIIALSDAGYDIYSFDVVDKFVKDGIYIPKGYQQWIIDLKAVLKDVEENYNYESLYFVGHSVGAYAICAILKDYSFKVRTVAAIATFNSGIEYAKMYYKKFSNFITKQMIYGAEDYNRIFYKEYADYSALDGVNNVDLPIIVFQGNDDKILPTECSLVGYRDEVKNDNVSFQTLDGNHDIYDNDFVVGKLIEFLDKY